MVVARAEEDEAEGQVLVGEGDDGTQSVLGVIKDWNFITDGHWGKILKVLLLTDI